MQREQLINRQQYGIGPLKPGRGVFDRYVSIARCRRRLRALFSTKIVEPKRRVWAPELELMRISLLRSGHSTDFTKGLAEEHKIELGRGPSETPFEVPFL